MRKNIFIKFLMNFLLIIALFSQSFSNIYEVESGETQIISELPADSREVENTCSLGIPVPTGTSGERTAFINNKPACVLLGCGCTGTTNCDTNNFYYQSGSDSAYSTNYCYYRDYEDVSETCDGSGSCVSGTCSSYSNSLQNSAGACRYISGCSGSTPGSVSNYNSGTSCSGSTDCDTNNFYYLTGTQSATSTSSCYYRDYADTSNTCNGFGSCTSGTCSSYSNSLENTAGSCQYISGCSGTNSGSVSNYNSGTHCSGTTGCDSNDYYYQSGTNSATGTSYCRFRDYSDVSNTCNGFGSCTSGTCTSYAEYETGTAGTCKYVSVGGGGSSCSVQNYASGTSCGSGMECDGSGSCVSAYTWTNPGSYVGTTCSISGSKQTGSCSTYGATNTYTNIGSIVDYSCSGGEPRYRRYEQTCN